MDKLKALVVDDDQRFGEKMGNILKNSFNCDVTLCFSGIDAIRNAEKEKFQIILLDLKMPGIDGFTVLANVQKNNPNIIAIVISGVIDVAVTKRTEDMGAWFLSKPVEPKALEHVVKSFLKKKNLI